MVSVVAALKYQSADCRRKAAGLIRSEGKATAPPFTSAYLSIRPDCWTE